MNYRVRRTIPGNNYVQLKSATLDECKRFLKDQYAKWQDVAKVGGYDPVLASEELTVTKGDRLVDRYEIEPA